MGAEQKVAIVTQASEGAGPGLVHGFLRRNYRVVAVAPAWKARAHSNLLGMSCDLREPDAAARVVDVAMSRYGRIDTLVNNAAATAGKAFCDCTADDWEALSRTSLAEFFPITQRALEIMLRSECGHVLTVFTAPHPATVQPAFCLAEVTKGCLHAAAQALAMELGPQRIRVNGVAAYLDQACRPERPSRRFPSLACTPDAAAVVEAALYLDAAPFLTGEIVRVNHPVR
ncbi:SDR family oxidoreductase [Oxalobacteraceae bacterium OM1]|nr:SDR family oxidoreductase [Oxalobacteraceae bacterium OM1]